MDFCKCDAAEDGHAQCMVGPTRFNMRPIRRRSFGVRLAQLNIGKKLRHEPRQVLHCESAVGSCKLSPELLGAQNVQVTSSADNVDYSASFLGDSKLNSCSSVPEALHSAETTSAREIQMEVSGELIK